MPLNLSKVHSDTTIASQLPKTVELGKKIREGKYCAYHWVKDFPDLTARIALPTRHKRYPLGFTVPYPMRLYTSLKFGIRDIIEYEYQAFQALPWEFKDHVPTTIHLARTAAGQSVLCMNRLVNFDGTQSRYMNRYCETQIHNARFWDDIEYLVRVLRQRRTYLLSVFHSGTHVVVRKRSDAEWQPVITHALKLGRTMYRLQFYLASESVLRDKFERGYRRFVKRFRPEAATISYAACAAS